ncbi:MAG: hypothetical protein ACOYCB_04665 [Fastidiosipilaceae bacterium]|nr:hypothetical protein [Clostridiaceae bacterium]
MFELYKNETPIKEKALQLETALNKYNWNFTKIIDVEDNINFTIPIKSRGVEYQITASLREQYKSLIIFCEAHFEYEPYSKLIVKEQVNAINVKSSDCFFSYDEENIIISCVKGINLVERLTGEDMMEHVRSVLIQFNNHLSDLEKSVDGIVQSGKRCELIDMTLEFIVKLSD